MTPDQRRVLEQYTYDAGLALGLSAWSVRVAFKDYAEVDGNECVAMHSCDTGTLHATITYTPRILDQEPHDQVHTVVHELLHCHTAEMWHQVYDDLDGPLGMESHVLFVASFKRSMERCVDGLADALAPALELIEWDDEVRWEMAPDAA